MRLGILHYSGPPTVGGVEQTVYYHSRHLAELGYSPLVIAGTGEQFDDRVELAILPQLYSGHPEVLEVKSELDHGRTDGRFESLADRLTEQLRSALAGLQVLIVHNALSLHKNLALTAALWKLHQGDAVPRWIGWHHDLAWQRPEYLPELHAGYPWSLLRQPWPKVRNVVVSNAQRAKLAELYGLRPEQITVIQPGIDLAIAARLSPLALRIVDYFDLSSADAVLLLPARITRRKNIEFAVRVLAVLRGLGPLDFRLLVTGPPGPHNPSNRAYLKQLQALQTEFKLDRSLHFLYALEPSTGQGLDPATMASLFSLCDGLLFPSQEEGFGIPLLEAAYARLPIFCSDIPPFRETAGEQAHYFTLSEGPDAAARLVLDTLNSDPGFAFRQRIRREHSWLNIVRSKVVPLLETRSDA